LLLLASLAPPLAAQAQRAPLTFAPTRAILELVPGAQAQQALRVRRLAGVEAGGSAESDLLRECADGEAQQGEVAKGFLFDIAARTWRVLLHPVAVSVHEELLKYASLSQATASGDYYRGGEASGGAGALSGRISCLRFTRFASADPANEDVALDFIASVHLEPQHDALRLRPLRLYVSQAAAKSANSRYAVAIALRAEAVWRDEVSGHRPRRDLR
jgi:hypothetical protein